MKLEGNLQNEAEINAERISSIDAYTGEKTFYFIMATKTTHDGLGILLLIPQLVFFGEFINVKPNPKEVTGVM